MLGQGFPPDIKPFTFVDVFVGGGSVAVAVANEFPNAKLVLNDLDEYIYSFWKILCKSDTKEINKLRSYTKKYSPPTVDVFKLLRREIEDDSRPREGRKAFYALFFNRTAFSGIFNSGPIGGFDQSGKYNIACRYNASKIDRDLERLYQRFSTINAKCYNKDYTDILKKYRDDDNVFLYLDPPYMKQGHLLYKHYMQKEQYQEMADLLRNCKARWMVSHDDCPDLLKIFDGWADIKTIEGVPYTINSIKGKKRTELLISKKD